MEIAHDVQDLYAHDTAVVNTDDVQRWLKEDKTLRMSNFDNLCLAVELRTDAKLIGYVTVGYHEGAFRQMGVNVLLNRRYRGYGYAAEALRNILNFLFITLHLHRVTASCDTRAVASQKFLERLGMRKEAEFIEDTWAGGKWRSTAWYAMLDSEYVHQVKRNS